MAVANALTFTGLQVAARALGSDGGLIEEVKQHYSAREQLQKAQAECNQKSADAVNKLNQELQQKVVQQDNSMTMLKPINFSKK